MFGRCDVIDCNGVTFMGWRPLTERIGRQICRYHWNGHKSGGFDLFKAFNLQRPACVPRQHVKTETRRCDCSRALQNGHEQEKPKATKGRVCKSCGVERRPGYTYCDNCGKKRKTESNRQRRRRAYNKGRNCNAFVTPVDNPPPGEIDSTVALRGR